MVRDRLSDDAWEQIADVFPPPAAVGRKRKDPRDVVDGILYVLRTGCPWRDLHEEFGPWQSVYHHFNKWASDGTLDEALGRLTYAKPAEASSFSAARAKLPKLDHLRRLSNRANSLRCTRPQQGWDARPRFDFLVRRTLAANAESPVWGFGSAPGA
ncbi:hypothetical protein Pla108_03960 [Botrimarina colliarenosi]|uniref:Insertion element IS402-like domain-containing protein n=1 Tax=Botrimarina colliarenosi TaxID=2528001 RepID=A0A5C6AJ08_9BACT|nr:hypothetical protein Pla108_03960 [Botrimarina colliarenosi]